MDKLDDVIKEMQWWMRIKADLPSVCGRAIEAMNEQKELLIKKQKEIDRLKAEQPKLLTLKETVNAKYPMDVFCEIKGEERVFAVTAPVQAQWIGKPDIRYWTARPTEEQRKAEPWEKVVSK